MVLVHESDPRFGAFDFRAAREKAPPDLQDMLDNHESLPFRRRGYERDGMLVTLIEHAGFKALYDARAPATATAKELAKVPTEIQHIDLERFHDRPVQAALVELLLLPKQDERFTSCVVMQGMGGTGKTVTTVAVVQDKAVRAHFSHIYWVTIGADAVGGKVKQLQSGLHAQLTGKSASSTEVQQKDAHEWLGMLVEAMTMDRALVVLDDPWLPEQVRFLNPVDSTQTEHRLLITTRIRGLAHSRATCIELAMMGKDEAVALLLEVAGITKQAYQIENPGSQWPPLAAYGLATECGLLPITLTITAQLVRSWGKGWEQAVLPLLQEEHGAGSGRGATTVEERVIGAGLKSLKGNADAAAIKALFEMFAVTQEDFVHPMAVIELLWQSCCAPSTEAGKSSRDISLSARLNVRQWTQLLIDQSLLLGSSSKGVHVHDIVLTFLRGTQSASELRALQTRVVEGLLVASTQRTATTGRGFQDTGSTVKAFEGEEVDWYVCNVASYHIKQAMDPSLLALENEDVKRWLLVNDETLVRAAAVTVGMAVLESLVAQYSAGEEWLEAAKLTWAIGMVSTASVGRVTHGTSALDLLEQAGSATAEAQQLELDIRGTIGHGMGTNGPAQKHNITQMKELIKRNSSLRQDPVGLYFSSVFVQLLAACGSHCSFWDAGKVPTEDTSQEAIHLQIQLGMPLFVKAVEESVGARKECIQLGYEHSVGCLWLMPFRLHEHTVEMHHQLLEKKWAGDGSTLTNACTDYRFERHSFISQGIGMRYDIFLARPCAQGMAEHCGDVQQIVQIFQAQLGGMRKFIKRGVPGFELPMFMMLTGYMGLELETLHPFGKEVAELLESCEGRCTDPSECKEWYESSAEFSAWRGNKSYGEGRASKDGRHHTWPKSTSIAHIQATLSLSLASMDSRNFELSWLGNLPAADSPNLHCMTASVVTRFVNTRVLIAEVLEWQGRHEEAIRCHAHLPTLHSKLCLLTCEQSLFHNTFIAEAFLCTYNCFLIQTQLRTGRTARPIQFLGSIKGSSRTSARSVPRCVGAADALSSGV
jgi:hypothetical protein